MFKIIGYCALPECGKPFTIRHGLCCSKSHRAEYSRRKGKNTLHIIPEPKIPITERTKEKKLRKRLSEEQRKINQKVAQRIAVRNYQARKRNAFPKWADRIIIKEIYEKAAKKTLETGIKHVVDHIVPLAGKNVCGFHVHNNLQILTNEENIKKFNHFDDWQSC